MAQSSQNIAQRSLPYYWKQAGFTAGVFSPEVACRDDVERYSLGAKEIVNFIPSAFGGVKRRNGMQFLNEAGNSSYKVRLVPFIYNREHAFVLEFGHQYIRVYRPEGAATDDNGNIVQITSPYSADDIFELKFTQSADTLYICHRDYPVKMLFRNSDVDWTISDFESIEGPFTNDNTTDITLTPSADSGTITVTASEGVFTSGMVGGLLRISTEVTGQSWARTGISGSWTSDVLKCNGDYSVVVSDPWTTIIYVEISNDNGATWLTERTITCWEDGSSMTISGSTEHYCLLRLRSESSSDGSGNISVSCTSFIQDGYVKITRYISSTQIEGEVQTDRNNYIFSLGGTEATTLWAIGSWNDDYGYPACATFYQDRLCFASTDAEPLGWWASCTGDYTRFRVQSEVEDDDAISVQLISGEANDILSMISLNSLMCFTYATEWSINSGSGHSAITPTAINASAQSGEGANIVQPLIVNDRVLYVTRIGDSVRDFAYDYSYDSYKGTDQTLYARHLFEGKEIVDWAFQKSPDNVIWVVQDDGTLLSFTYLFDERVYAWAEHETDGYVESVASIPGETKDELFLVVRRTNVNGSTRRYIEKFEWQTDLEASPEPDTLDLSQMTYLDSHLMLYDKLSPISVSWNEERNCLAITYPNHNLSTGDRAYTLGNYNSPWDDHLFDVVDVDGDTFYIAQGDKYKSWYDEYGTPDHWGHAYTNLSGLDHLNGRSVRVLGMGSDMGKFTVSNGSITLPRPVCKACIGLDYTSKLETLDIQTPMDRGYSRGILKRVVKPKAQILRSWGGEIGVNDYDHMVRMKTAPTGTAQIDKVGKNPNAETGLKEVEAQLGIYEDCTLTVRQTQPFPLTVLSLMAEVYVTK